VWYPDIADDHAFNTITDVTAQAVADIDSGVPTRGLVVEVTGDDATIDAASNDPKYYMMWAV
jgi:uncharacterized protein YqkB